jgi:hypothetical protein
LERHSQFAYHDHIERRTEHRGDLEGHRHPSPWKTKDHDLGGRKGQQALAEAPTGVETVTEHYAETSFENVTVGRVAAYVERSPGCCTVASGPGKNNVSWSLSDHRTT